jgi:hypothetical protein
MRRLSTDKADFALCFGGSQRDSNIETYLVARISACLPSRATTAKFTELDLEAADLKSG